MSLTPCPAARHNTRDAYDDEGCRCPEIVARVRAARRERSRRLTGIGAKRWPKHHADVDPVDVERACAGNLRGAVSITERTVAVARLTAAGLSTRDIAVVLQVAPRTVTRYRKRATS